MDKQEIREAIAAKVRTVIEEEGYKQVDVADGAGIARGSITQLLRGKQGFKVCELIGVCNVLECSLLDIIDSEWLDVDPVQAERVAAIAACQKKVQGVFERAV